MASFILTSPSNSLRGDEPIVFLSLTQILSLAARSKSQRPEKCDQRFAIFLGQIQPEGMAIYRIGLHAVRLKARRNVIVARTARVKPVFEVCAPATMPEHASIPHALQRRYLVVACAAPRPESQIRVCAHADRQDIVLFQMILGDGEAFGRSQFVISVERRRMSHGAAFPRENVLSTLSQHVEFVGIRRRFK